MSEPKPEALFRRWRHSFEEDRESLVVYRPEDYPLPRARGRAGLEIRADGTAIEWQIGRGDANQPVEGRWVLERPDRLHLLFPGGSRDRTIELVEVEGEVLRVREVSEA